MPDVARSRPVARRWCSVPLAVITSLVVSGAAAADDVLLAETLFQEGKRLLDEGRLEEACPKLRDSLRLDRAGGTAIALAVCHERAGKVASAWTTWNEALAYATRDQRADREKRARDAIAALTPRLPRLVLAPQAPSDRFVVRHDGVEVPVSAWGTAIAVDPGEHEVEASAPGKRTWSQRVTSTEGASITVTIPALEDAPAPTAASTALPSRAVPASSTQRTVGYALGGIGAAGIVVGSIAGLVARSKAGSANDRCPTVACTDAGAVDDSRTASRAAVVSNVSFAIGLTSLATAAVLIVTAPAREPATTVATGIEPQGGWIAVKRTF